MSLPRSKRSISQAGLDHLKRVEGERLDVYIDAAGHPTVGVGHKILPEDNLKLGDSISQFQSDSFLRIDAAKAEQAVNDRVIVPLNQAQFDALTSFVFNVGADNFRRSTLLRKLNEYDYQGALAEFERWNKITNPNTGQKEVHPGLVSRRFAEQELFIA